MDTSGEVWLNTINKLKAENEELKKKIKELENKLHFLLQNGK